MARSKEKNKALELRRQGESIREIAKRVGVAKSTASLWCRDIQLSSRQINILHERMVKGGYKGRMKGARAQYDRRLEKIEEEKRWGRTQIKKLSERELFLVGLALYWGEGNKKTRGVRISNSDPAIINLMIRWLREIWKIEPERFTFSIFINIIHKDRVNDVEMYWSKKTGIPREQFYKTILIKAKNKKVYKNFNIHYGTAMLGIRRPAEIYYKIMGLIDALSQAGE